LIGDLKTDFKMGILGGFLKGILHEYFVGDFEWGLK